MRIINKGKCLLCFNTKEGRVDVLPAVVTDDKRLDSLKGKDKIFDHYLEKEVLKEVKAEAKKSPKDTLKAELVALGGIPGSLGVEKLELAIRDILEEKAIELDVEFEGLSLDELRTAVAKAEADQ